MIFKHTVRANHRQRGPFPLPTAGQSLSACDHASFGFRSHHIDTQLDRPRIIHLEPWSRVEGTFRIGKSPVANVAIGIDVARLTHSAGKDRQSSRNTRRPAVPTAGSSLSVSSRAGRIGRSLMLMADEGAREVTSTCKIAASFPAGQTVHIDLGGTGRSVVGKLQPPEGFTGEVRWNFAIVHVQPDEKGEREDTPFITATVDRDGKFHIDDAPTGQYSLSVRFDRDDAGHLDNHHFAVPPTNDGRAANPSIWER